MITNVCFTVMLRDKTIIRRRLRTPPRKMFTAEGLEQLLADEAGRIEQFFPGREFRLVPLRGGKHFNFVEDPVLTL